MAHAMERTGLRKLVERRLASSNYRLLKILGEGTYGTVYLARDGVNKQLVAIKVIEKRRISSDDMVRVRREIQVLSVLRQPNIIQIYRVHEDDSSLYLVMEYADGGELYDFVERRKKLSSSEARSVFRQIVAAVHYCHKNGVVHRDLKLENILLNSRFVVKLTDFGLCNYFTPTGRLATFCGSPLYASPEIISGSPYMGPEIDCWSLGVLLYALVYGSMPFGHAEFAKLRAQILSGQFFAPPDAGEFSDAHDLICQCLTVSASARATIDQISMHWWTNLSYLHYPHCDIYGGSGTDSVQTCSCFFDVLNQQLSSPPDQFRGKLAAVASSSKNNKCNNHNSKNDNSSEFMGVHARNSGGKKESSSRSHSHSHHHHHRDRQKVPSSNNDNNQEELVGQGQNNSLEKDVSVDSLNNVENGDKVARNAWNCQHGASGAGLVPPLNVFEATTRPKEAEQEIVNGSYPHHHRKISRSASAPGYLQSRSARQMSSTSFDLPREHLLKRSASLGRRPHFKETPFEHDEEEECEEHQLNSRNISNNKNNKNCDNTNIKLLSSLLDPSLECLDNVGSGGEDCLLHRQLSNYDNLAAAQAIGGTSPHSFGNHDFDLPPPIDGAFDASDDIAYPCSRVVPPGFSAVGYDVGSAAAAFSCSVSGTSASTTTSASSSCSSASPLHITEEKRTEVKAPLSFSDDSSGSSSSCSSNASLSCSCSCSSIYDQFQQDDEPHSQAEQVMAMMMVPPLQFLNTTNHQSINGIKATSDSNSSSSSGDLYVDDSARSAPAALAITEENTKIATLSLSKPATLVDSISSRSDSLSINDLNSNSINLNDSQSTNNSDSNKLRVLDDDELVAIAHENLSNDD